MNEQEQETIEDKLAQITMLAGENERLSFRIADIEAQRSRNRRKIQRLALEVGKAHKEAHTI